MIELDFLNTIKINRVSEIIVEQIRRAILEGKLKPGDKLPPERILIKKFKASKFTVREAIRTLETLGFLEVKKGPGGGAIITELDFKPVKYSLFSYLHFLNITVQNLCEIRKIIEPSVVEIATMRTQKIILENIYNLLKKTQNEFEAGKNIREMNVEFHMEIAKMSRNPLLITTLDFILDLQKQCNIILRPDKLSEFSADNLKAHWEIYNAMRKKEHLKAKEAMIIHLKQVERRLKPLEERLRINF